MFQLNIKTANLAVVFDKNIDLFESTGNSSIKNRYID